ncbi:hypothetical protein [Pectobacterium fontis]|uniref:Uncharacterized protein n=1 Tax=Pectobacterium fontis TaxID=2558042 RepID=A0A7V8IIW2_9GAMM|nr:hypothetical protein [Pectobacterium fontis]KHN51879.1 hypothetical protein OI69_09435 [Pectobacterium fontis]
MKILINVQKNWPDNVKELDSSKYDQNEIPWCGKELFFLHEDGRVYQRYVKMPFIVGVDELSLFSLTTKDDNSFLIEEITDWPKGVNIRKGFVRAEWGHKSNGCCWYVFPDGGNMYAYFDAPTIQEHHRIYNVMPFITCEVLN